MDKLSVFEAKARFSEVVSKAEQGKQTVITKRGMAVARVVPERKRRPERWDRSDAIDRIVAFSKDCRLPRKVDLGKLIAEGRL
jgi:prevent-host-death family protein